MEKFKDEEFKYNFILRILEEVDRVKCGINLEDYSIAVIAYNFALESYKKEMGSQIVYLRALIKAELLRYYREKGYYFNFSNGNILLDEDFIKEEEKVEYYNKIYTDIDRLDKELKSHNISYRKIRNYTPRKESIKNYLLNVAMIFSREKFLLDYIKRTGKIPYKRLRLYGEFKEDIIEKYNKYVVVLTTLFSNSDLIYLISYIGIKVGENDG